MSGNLFDRLAGMFGRKPPAPPPATDGKPQPKADPHKNMVRTLQDGIRRLHKCESEHAESLPVTLDVGGKIVWQGLVELFTLNGHPKAKRCYAWMHPPGRPVKCVAVLERPPIDSARKAVYSTIVKEGGIETEFSTSSQFLQAVQTVVKRDGKE
jgi:hypothetical protein